MSGSTVGGILGAGIGLVVTGGNPAGAKWGAWIGSTVGGIVAPGTVQGPKVGDAQQQTSQAGMPRPVVFGHPAPFAGNLIDGEKIARKVTRKTKQGKGGPTVKTQVFLLTSAIRVSEGAIAGYVRIWEDDVVVYDARTTFPAGWEGYSKEIRIRQSKWMQKARLYLGTEDQLPDPALEAIHGVGNTPYYRGTAYITVQDAESQDGTAKRYKFEVAAAGTAGTSSGFADLAPVGWWKLDETSGTVAADSSGNGFDGTYSSGSGHAAAVTINSSGSMDAGIASVSVPYHAALNVGLNGGLGDPANWAICASVKLDSRSGGTYGVLIANFGSYAFGYQNYLLDITNASGLPFVGFTDSGTNLQATSGPGALALNRTYRLWGVRTDTTLEIYLDGALVGSTPHSNTTSWSGGADGLHIGWTMDGKLSDVAVFDYAVSAAQISADAEYFVGVNPAVQAPIPDADGSVWDLLSRTIIGVPTNHATFVPDSGADLGYVEAQICARCNVPTGKLNLDALAGITIPGFLVTDQPTGADTLLPLMQANFHDLPEVDGQIRAVLRGSAIAMSFTDEDLIDTGEDEEIIRPQEIEFPLKVSVVTQDPAADYAAIPQSSLRFSPSVRAANEVVLQVPIPYGADDAARIAHKLHKIVWSNAEARIERVLPQEFALVVPSDAIGYDNRRWLVTEREYSDGEIRIKAVYERASDVSSSVVGQPITPPTPPGGTVLGPTIFFAMNLPSLRPEDAVAGVYLVAMGVFDGWAGADIYLSTDGGLTETLVKEITQASKMGQLTADEPIGGEPLTIRLYDADDTLDNATTAQVAVGQNLAAVIDASDNTELLAFEVAVETTDGDWEISTLTRGILGTTEVNRLTGERFAMLDYAYFLPIDASFAGQTLIFRAVTKGTVVDANPTVSLVFDPPTFIIDGGGP